MATKHYKVSELREWFNTLSKIHRDFLKMEVAALIERWVEIHNKDGMLPAMQWWKNAIAAKAPIQKSFFSHFLDRTIANGAHFSFAS